MKNLTFDEWASGRVMGSMEREFARDAWKAAQEAIKQHDAEPVAWLDKDGSPHTIGAPSNKNFKSWLYLSAPSIPEGWQLVPKEPTDLMIDVGTDAHQDAWNKFDRGRTNAELQLLAAYRAMLAASPQPTEGELS